MSSLLGGYVIHTSCQPELISILKNTFVDVSLGRQTNLEKAIQNLMLEATQTRTARYGEKTPKPVHSHRKNRARDFEESVDALEICANSYSLAPLELMADI